MDEGDSSRWLKKHLKASYEPKDGSGGAR